MNCSKHGSYPNESFCAGCMGLEAPMIRGIGRSTAQALEALAEAIKFPGEWVEYRDHAIGYAPGAGKYWADQLRNMVNALGLQKITVDYSPSTGKIMVKSEWEGIKL